jgi:hypothetical protein
MKFVKLLNLKIIGDIEKGFLSYFELNNDFDFEIKRIYFMFDVPKNSIRGYHAHKTLKQVMFCAFGKIKIVINNGTSSKSFILDTPNKVLVMTRGFWREIYYLLPNSVLVVGASDIFSEDDYIRDYDKFLEFSLKGGYNQ